MDGDGRPQLALTSWNLDCSQRFCPAHYSEAATNALPGLQRQLDLEPEHPGVRMRRCRAGADVILDARPELQRRGDLDGVGELDKLLIGLNRRPLRRQLKLKPRIDVGPDQAEAKNVQLAARKQAPTSRARLVVVFEFGGVL